MAKYIIGIIVIGLIVAGLWYSGVLTTLGLIPSQTATTTPQAATSTAPVLAQPENGMSANNDASDVALVQDIAAIDAQMQGLTQDSANVDSSLSDTSTQ